MDVLPKVLIHLPSQSRLFSDRSHSIKQTTAKGNRGLGPERSGNESGNMEPQTRPEPACPLQIKINFLYIGVTQTIPGLS